MSPPRSTQVPGAWSKDNANLSTDSVLVSGVSSKAAKAICWYLKVMICLKASHLFRFVLFHTHLNYCWMDMVEWWFWKHSHCFLISYVLSLLQRSAQKGKTQPTVTEYIKQHELPTDRWKQSKVRGQCESWPTNIFVIINMSPVSDKQFTNIY